MPRVSLAGRPAKSSVRLRALPETPRPFEPPGPVGRAFMESDDFVRGIRGPFGSGKSVLCVHEILRRAQEQKPLVRKDAAGNVVSRTRYTRWAIVRNTFPELKLTTVKTWLRWVPESLGTFLWSAPFTHHLHYPMPDGTIVDCEVIFLALDSPDDVKKLLSLDLTGVWVNEAREVAKEIVDACTGRVDRFPDPDMGGPSWTGVIMDTNSPGEEHWWPIIAGDVDPPEWMGTEERLLMVKPPDWSFFTQAPAMLEKLQGDKLTGYVINPERENPILGERYYIRMISGKSRTWIKIYILNEYATLISGKAVYEKEWNDDLHIAKQRLMPIEGIPIILGLDYGRTPAAAFKQRVGNQMRLIHELVLSGVSTKTFGMAIVREVARLGWQSWKFDVWGDPSGDDLKETSDDVPSQILRNCGVPAKAAPTNDPLVRIETTAALMSRMDPEGPAFLVSPHCKNFIVGARGGYHFKPVGGLRTGQYDSRPNKNRSSHIQDADQYANIGAGEWRPVMIGSNPGKVVTVNRTGHPLERQAQRVARETSRFQSRFNRIGNRAPVR